VLATAKQRGSNEDSGHWAAFEARVLAAALLSAVAEAVAYIALLPLVVSKRILFDIVVPWGPRARIRSSCGWPPPCSLLRDDVAHAAADWLRLPAHDPGCGRVSAFQGELVCCTGHNAFGGWRAETVVRRVRDLFDRRNYRFRDEAHAVNLIAVRSPCPLPGRFDDALLVVWREPVGGSRHCGPVHAPLTKDDGWHVGLFACTTDPVLFHSARQLRCVLGRSVLAEGIYPYELRVPENEAIHRPEDDYEQLHQGGGVDMWDEWEGLVRDVTRGHCRVNRAAVGNFRQRWRAGSIVVQHHDDYAFLLSLLRSAELDHGNRFSVAVARQGDLFPDSSKGGLFCWKGEACFEHVLRHVLAESPPPNEQGKSLFCTVEAGEYALAIARREGLSLKALQALNPSQDNLAKLVPGQRLRVRDV